MTSSNAPAGPPPAGGCLPGGGDPPSAAGHPARAAGQSAARPHTSSPPASAGETGPGGLDTPLVIEVRGKPAPQGSKKSVLHSKTRKVVTFEQGHERIQTWREAVKDAAGQATDAWPEPWRRLLGPVAIEIICCFDKPKSAPKTRRTWPTTRSSGDIDKLQRSTLDALTAAGVFKDDSQVICVHAVKVFTDDAGSPLPVPGAVIRVWEAGI